MEWAGLGWDGPPDEGLVFGLGGDLAFTYVRTGANPFFVGRGPDLELRFCDRLGIATRRDQTDDPAEGWRWVTGQLDAGRPVMVWADIADLPYLRVRLSNARHDIVVIGYDDEAAWVVDNDRADVQRVPLAALAKARDSHGFGGPNRHATYPMGFPAALPDLLPAARDAAAAGVAGLRGDQTTGALPPPPGETLLGTGLSGVEVFAADVAAWPDALDPGELAAARAALPVFIEKAGTGGGMFRRLQADFCRDVARLTGDRPFAAAADAYAACAAAWSALAALARDPGTDHAALTRTAFALPALERAAVESLAAAAGSEQG
ncbi:PRTRC system protein E [Actinomadura craniellae]|uniref:PRTRC system protein E n=2 Tax=Actinomadura craniellae TaxID=2231787 RepID=A0A365HB15_9ACTN|nr:PRTRC system protein E [Actinomadura craniellae]